MDGMIAYKNLRPRKAGLGFKLTSLFLAAVLFAVLLPLTALAKRLNAQDTFVLTGQDYARAKGDPGALLRPWYNKRVLDLSCVREHDDLLFSPALTDALVRGFGFLLPYYDYLEAVTRREDA